VSNRDFLTLRNVYPHDGDSVLIVSQSVNLEKKPFKANTVVSSYMGRQCSLTQAQRATTRNARLFTPIEGEPGSYRLTLVDHVDPRGNVPSFLVNMFKKKAAEAILKMDKIYGKSE
jgi:hypothetical protein